MYLNTNDYMIKYYKLKYITKIYYGNEVLIVKKTVFIFDIDNSKNDFSKAYYYIHKMKTNQNSVNNWEETHISVIENIWLSKNDLKNKNILKNYITKVENIFENRVPINRNSHMLLSENTIFYFRVKNTSDNDIVNLHYYYLMKQELLDQCAMGIITHDIIKERMTASFLIGVKENFIGKEIPYQIVKYKSNNKYKISLLPCEKESVFFLRAKLGSKVLTPHEIDDKGLNVSKTFFPLLNLQDRNVYLTLTSSAYDILGEDIFQRKKQNKYIYNDLLYSLVYEEEKKDFENLDFIINAVKKNKSFKYDRTSFLGKILSRFAINCLKNIKRNKSSAEKREIIEYANNIINETSTLAFCIFVAFWSFMIDNGRDNIQLDALLMDSEDYADGLLQLIENATKHAKNGYFCFRIHVSDSSSSIDSSQYLKRYELKLQEKKFYLEALISDYNNKYDIPSMFLKNIRHDIINHSNSDEEREYIVSQELIEKISKNIKLKDLFNYENSELTKKLWEEFYSESKNLISHYGLLVFERIVDFSQGIFYVVSSKEYLVNNEAIYINKILENIFEDNHLVHLPGTQYEILLPIEVSHIVKDTGLNYSLNTSDALAPWNNLWIKEDAFKELHNTKLLNEEYYEKLLRPYFKSQAIYAGVDNILHILQRDLSSPNEYTILCFDVEKIDTPITSEIFSKIFISILCQKSVSNIKYFAIKNASSLFMNTFVRIFSLLYMKTGQGKIMDERQVYICSHFADKEILFYGNSIINSLEASKNITICGKGEPTREFRFLERQTEKAQEHIIQSKSIISILPFDVIIDGVFNEKVKSDLEKDIQNDEFGCCLKDVHMRVGSKIHIYGNYYEASLLFSNSNYISRFAYLIYEKLSSIILKATKNKNVSKIILIGYESYSESLIINLKKVMNSNFNDKPSNYIDYMIYYENTRNHPFSRWEEVCPDASTKFVVVVPIGSTLTTHEKITADLVRKLKIRCKNINEYIIAHYSVILIRNSDSKIVSNHCRAIESNFWEDIIMDSKDGHNYVLYKNMNIGANNRIEFFTSVENKWRLPNECEYCFPKKNINEEKPLIHVNRSSVVPMTMYGPSRSIQFKRLIPSYEKDEKNLSPLKDSLCYGHYLRGKDNHYQYYFKTDKVMDSVLQTQKNKFEEWLSEISTLAEKSSSQKIIFNFIVAPLHKTNAQFVHHVNNAINAKQILWLDTKREYRDNVKAKYSNLTTLIKNMIYNVNEEVHVHFHFVDDTITSGFTINRSKNLLKSLFYDIDGLGQNIHIHLFSSVILLLNRCSRSTMENYVTKDRFKSYIGLNISVMRSHNDACVPCKKYKNYAMDIYKESSTNKLSNLSKEFSSQYILKDEAEIDKWDGRLKEISKKYISISQNSIREKDYGFYQMISTHRFNTLFDTLGGKKNNSLQIETCIWNELSEICSLHYNNSVCFEITFSRICSSLSVLSRPFLSYRHSTYNAITKVLLDIFEHFLFGIQFDFLQKKEGAILNDFLSDIKKKATREFSCIFLMLLVSCLSNVDSTSIIRPFVINKFFEFYKSNHINNPSMIYEYAMRIKHLLTLSGKENLSVWLERTLKKETNIAPRTITSKDIFQPKCIEEKSFINLLLLENVSPIISALEECKKNKQLEKGKDNSDIIQETLKQYYCKNYCDFVGIDATKDVDNYNQHCQKVFLPIFNLYSYLNSKKDPNGESYYTDFLHYVEPILQADKVMLMIKNGNSVNRLYPKTLFANLSNADDDKQESFVNRIIDNDSNINNIGDTLFWENSKDNHLGAIKLINDENSNQNNLTPVWYLVFIYKNKSAENEYSFIIKARNLLAMRYDILNRLNKDFDNNIIGDFLNFKSTFQKLGTDKSGSHTPYEELRDGFFDLLKTYIRLNELGLKDYEKTIFANQYKLISDSLISKWYVHSQLNTFPELMNPKDVFLGYSASLKKLKQILVLARYANVNVKGSTIYCDQTIRWNVPWDKILIDTPKKCSYMWCCAFLSLIFNALHHGYYVKKDGINKVTIDVSYDNNMRSFIISNRMKEGSVIDDNSVTLTALKYYFDSYYGINKFNYKSENIGHDKYFIVILPCSDSQKEE